MGKSNILNCAVDIYDSWSLIMQFQITREFFLKKLPVQSQVHKISFMTLFLGLGWLHLFKSPPLTGSGPDSRAATSGY